jgi:hypothetical protein
VDGFVQRLAARRFNERAHALMSTRDLPAMSVDLACWRRLEAMCERLRREDPELAEDAMTHVVYAAIMGGLRESEREAGEVYDENTGRRVT